MDAITPRIREVRKGMGIDDGAALRTNFEHPVVGGVHIKEAATVNAVDF